MTVEQTSAVVITCDNPACPGNDLDPADRTGWTFMSVEVYGQPTTQHVFCCLDCASASTDTIQKATEDAAFAVPVPQAPAEAVPVEPVPVEPLEVA